VDDVDEVAVQAEGDALASQLGADLQTMSGQVGDSVAVDGAVDLDDCAGGQVTVPALIRTGRIIGPSDAGALLIEASCGRSRNCPTVSAAARPRSTSRTTPREPRSP
jgi:hypothetical protein